MKLVSNNLYLSRMKKYKTNYILLFPAIITVRIFCYLPMLGVIMAFQEYDIIGGITGSSFVGLENFKRIFTTPKFMLAIKNTLLYSGVNIIFGTPLPIILAILLNELKMKWFRNTIQTISYLPYFLSWISVIGIFQAMFSSEGTVNSILARILGDGYTPVNILMDSKYFLGIIFWTGQWKNVGWSSIVFLAAITGINQSLYEAAAVDGCGRLRQALHITLPSIMPTIAIVFIMATASLVQSNFDQVFGFQNPYIQESTEVINTLVYREGILNAEYSMATAFGIAQGLVSFLLVYITNMIVKKASDVGIW